MPFVSAVAPAPEESGRAWWFLFRKDRLLVEQMDSAPTVPCVVHPSDLGLKPVLPVYLGALDGRSCYAAELTKDTFVPEHLTFKGLRGLFDILPQHQFIAASYGLQLANWEHTHLYCSRCGHRVEDMKAQRAKICSQCHLINHPRIHPCIIVAVIRDQRILLVRRNQIQPTFYSVIAGYVEVGETLEACVRREVKEEASVDVKQIRYFGSQSWPYSSSLMVAFTAAYGGGDIAVDGQEIIAANWYSAENLPPVPGWGSIARQLIDWFVEKIAG